MSSGVSYTVGKLTVSVAVSGSEPAAAELLDQIDSVLSALLGSGLSYGAGDKDDGEG